MQPNRILMTALAGGIVIGAASTGYVITQVASASRYGYASHFRPAASGNPAGVDPSTMIPAAPPGGGTTFEDSSLAQFIAQKAGTGLAGKAPQNVSLGQVKALSDQVPPGASIDTQTGTITFHTTDVSFTVVAVAPGMPDMAFTIAGLANPAIVVPSGSRVTVRFINNDPDEAHGWLITGSQPPFEFGQPDTPAIAGAYAGIIGDPTAAGDGANTITFTAGSTGSYQYICPMPGHAQLGMHGSFTVVRG
jgi:rusticyanin